jgi:hypothetical protein
MDTIINLENDDLVYKFKKAKPFPHLVIDNFFEDEISKKIFEESLEIKTWINTHKNKDNFIHNRVVADYSEIKGCLKEVINFFYSKKIISFMEKILNVPIFFDPNVTRGGGIQRAINGAHMDIHLDNSWNPKLKAWTVANLLYYSSTNWLDEYNGHLELWNKKECVEKILPCNNRVVICANTNESYHGYPKKIAAPENAFRQTFVLFYYSQEPLVHINKRESALWFSNDN